MKETSITDPAPIDVWILSGYLGAGKTTTLNSMLKSEFFSNKNLALIINEFGNMGIDGKIVESKEHPKYEINKGSIFCICTKTDFIRYMTEISENVRPQALLIEATGIAETRDIESFVKEPHLKDRFRVRANICIVDAVNFTKAAAYFRPVTSQVRWADCVIINKTDLIRHEDVETLKELITKYNKQARIFVTSHGNIDMALLKDIRHIQRKGEALDKPPEPIFAVSFETGQPIDEKRFLEVIRKLGNKLLRLKGNVNFAHGSEYFEVVGSEIIRKPRCDNLEKTAFVIIAWQTEKDHLTEMFESSYEKPLEK